MFTYWTDFDRSFEAMDSLLRSFFDTRTAEQPTVGGVYRGSYLTEDENEVVLTADMPGVRIEDLDVNLHEGMLTVQAERKSEIPEGYEARRLERGDVKFARTYSLPAAVDPERTRATLQNGVLTVRMEKAANAKPRRIAITA